MAVSDQKDDFEDALAAFFSEHDIDHVRWQDDGLCHGMWSIFDLPQRPDGTGDRKRYREHLRWARPICFECPVFQECWDDAYDNHSQGVVQAGALLGHTFGAVRKRRLIIAYDMYLEYQNRKAPNGNH